MITNKIDKKLAFISVLSNHMRAVWGMSLYILTAGTWNCKWNRFWTSQLWELWVWKVPLWLVLVQSCAPPPCRPLIWSFFFYIKIFLFSFIVYNWQKLYIFKELPCTSNGKESACSAGDLGLIPGWGTASGERNGNPLRYPCLENPMDGGAWRAIVRGVSQSQTRLSHCHYYIYLSCAAWCSHTHIHCWNVFQPGDELGDPHSQAKAEQYAHVCSSPLEHFNNVYLFQPTGTIVEMYHNDANIPITSHNYHLCLCICVHVSMCVCWEHLRSSLLGNFKNTTHYY